MIRLLALLILFITATHLLGYPRIPDFIYYGTFAGTFVCLILYGWKLEFRSAYIPFVLSILFSLWVNDIPSVFKSPTRAVAFFCVAFTIGPFIKNIPFQVFRKKLFIYVLALIRGIVFLSFIGYLLGLEMVRNRTGFCGFTDHSMLLGPLAGIASLNYFYWIFLEKNGKARLLNLFFMFTSLLTLILTGSRSALGACVVGLLFFLFTLYRKRLFRVIQLLVVFAIIMAATNSIWWPYTESLRAKMEYGEEQGSTTATRDLLWTDRIAEFRAYPLFGVGFASYNTEIAKDKFNKKSGTIEPGSSWLFLLSSMGLMGFLSFLIPAVYMIFRAFMLPRNILNNVFLTSILMLMMAHMFFEGHVVASGAYLCFILWLLLSQCYCQLIEN